MYLIGAIIFGILMQTVVIVVPAFAKAFNVVPLNKKQWLIVTLISILPIFIMEGQKKINEIKHEKVIYRTIE